MVLQASIRFETTSLLARGIALFLPIVLKPYIMYNMYIIKIMEE